MSPPGGAGAKATAQLTVTPGQKLYVDFGGGGAGGNETNGCKMPGGAGGAASDVREEPGGNALESLQSRLLVAGGGGGGGDGEGEYENEGGGCPGSYPECFRGLGGAGGSSGSSAQSGKPGEANKPGDTPGGGGEGGGSGSGGKGGSAGSNSGAAGSSGVLGEGGAGAARIEGCACGISGPGGGGGGGFYGGGGGGSDDSAGGGGGAGSSYIAPGATNTNVEADTTDPQEVVITYTVVTAAAPTATIESPANNETYAVGQKVKTKFSCTEGASGPGIETCKDEQGKASESELTTSAAGTFTYTVTATSKDGQTGTASITYTVAAAPTASISSPTNGNTYAVGQSVATSFSCTESVSGPGIASCKDSNGASSPGKLNTSTAGTFTYTVTATSKDGQTGTASIAYNVGASFLGFTQPLPKGNMVSTSATIPVKFGLGSYQGVALSDSAARLIMTKVTLSANANGLPALATVACSYSTTNHSYECNLKTPSGVKTGSSHPYYITAYEQVGASYLAAPLAASPRTPNPEIVYFK